jgi:hypothetical protein
MRALVRPGPWPQWASAFRDSPHLRATAPAAMLGWAALAQLALIAGFAAPLCLGGQALVAPIQLAALRGAVAGHWPELAAHALAMAAIMAVPATNAPLGHVLGSSFPERAALQSALFLLAFALLWCGFAILAQLGVLVSAVLAPELRLPIAAAALVAAAAWQVAPARRRAFGRCHGTVPVYADGWAGMRSSAAYGLRIGRACAATCGPLMFAAMLSPLPLPAMAAAALLATRERYGRPGSAAANARIILGAALLLLLLHVGIGLD